MSESCRNCRFWGTDQQVALANENDLFDEKLGYCLRFPPVFLGTEEADYYAGSINLNWAQPVTREGDWCGEYRPAEALPPGEYPKNWADVLPDVGMTTRARKACWRLQVRTLEELATKTFSQVMSEDQVGATTAGELQRILNEHGLFFYGDPRGARQ